jgi:hypothetical protein
MRDYAIVSLSLSPIMVVIAGLLMRNMRNLWNNSDEIRNYVEVVEEISWGTNWQGITDKQLYDMKIMV